MKKTLILLIVLFLYGCTQKTIEPAHLPEDDILVMAHRGASAYVEAHTLAAYELAVQMNTDYIEIDLHMTKDGKLVALHDETITLNGAKHAVANVTFNEIQRSSSERKPNKTQSVYSSARMNDLQIVDLEEILLNYGDSVNYYIELKNADTYPGIEKELLRLLREHKLLNREDTIPKVILQSFDEESLRNIFAMEPDIPLIKLYKLDNDESFSKKELKKLTQYASGVGVNADAVSHVIIESTQNAGLHIHAYTINDEESMRKLLKLGVNGFFTDRPDVGSRVKNEKYHTD